MNRLHRTTLMTFLLLAAAGAASGQSGRQYHRTAIHNGNQVRTVFGNWGVIGQPCADGPRGAWRNDNDGYLGDVSPLVGAEVGWQDHTFHSVATCPVNRPTLLRDEDPRTGKAWAFEPVDGYLNGNQTHIATSTDRNSWPPFWPDKLGDLNDPGWRGSWNGYFGKRINADQESYYVMDDNNDERFNVASNNILHVAFRPDSNNLSRFGLGLEVRVRGMQWAQFLAKDNIFWLYDVRNAGTTDYSSVVFGMLVGTYVGVTGCDDRPQEYADDWSFYDVRTNLTYTGDYGRDMSHNPLWVGPVGMVGYAFLESPGNPFDGIDNDGDADSVLDAASAPFFRDRDFTDSTLVRPGLQIVLIDTAYQRTIYTVPNVDSVLVHTRGFSKWLYPHALPGQYIRPEGSITRDAQGNPVVNANAYDGADNDFDGLIDENYNLHYHQLKRTPGGVTLIDVLRPVRHVDYIGNLGTSPYTMIDERRDDLIDNNRDWNVQFDDLGRDGIPNTGDYGENDELPTSGYDDLHHDTGLPGEPHIDKTDVRESDQIGLTSFFYFSPANDLRMGDDESLWKDLAPGFFDVPASIVNNRPEFGQDGDFIYGSGYFPLRAGSTERFSLALVYGGGKGGSVDDDIADLLKNKKTVQKIYDANYQFPQPPDRPTLKAVAGDRQVTLYWDRKSEATIDPVLRIKDFEGYKLYKSTDPNFTDIFTITDATGSPQGYVPLAQYDLVDGVSGYFRANAELYEAAAGYSFYLGKDNGLVHSYIDKDVENGKRYFYALVAYDRGDETIGIFPSENTKFVTVTPTGDLEHDANVAVVTPGAPSAGYVKPADGITITTAHRYGTGNIYYKVVDRTKVTNHTYVLEFLDTQMDGLDNNGNGLADGLDSTEWTRQTSFYSVRDLSQLSEQFVPEDTLPVRLAHQNLIPSSVTVRNPSGSVVPPDNYRLNTGKGEIRAAASGMLPTGTYSITFEYYPVFESPYIEGSPFVSETRDADIFDGIQLVFNNDWSVRGVDSISGWTVPRLDSLSHPVNIVPYVYNFVPLELGEGASATLGYARPADYEVRFAASIVDTSVANPDLFADATPVNFRVYNETESTYVKFWFIDGDANGRLSPNDEIILLDVNPRGVPSPTWDLFFISKVGDPRDTVYALTSGDKLVLKTSKPFRNGDVFSWTTVPEHIDAGVATHELSRIRVVPNPYVASSTHEPPPTSRGGRIRRIEFTRLPADATIKIFTARGELIRTLSHHGVIDDGTEPWDLKTDENLDVAFGVYFYIVDSPAGTKTGKIAIIK